MAYIEKMERISRRKFLASVPASVAVLGGCSAPTTGNHPVAETPTDWPSFRLGTHNTGYAKGVADPDDEPAVRWTLETGGDIWGSPVVSDGLVYVGSADGYLYALDSRTGMIEWRYQTDHRIEGTPAVDRSTVYVGSYDKNVYALDAETGEKRWSYEADGLVRGSPTVVDGSVYIGVGCFNLACSWYADEEDAPEIGQLCSLDRSTGELNWRFEAEGEVVSTPAVHAGTVYVGSSDSCVYALDADSGEREWKYEAEDWIWSSPTVAFGTVFFGDFDADVYAVDAETGTEVWTFDTLGAYISGSTAVDEDTVYVGVVPANYPQSAQRNDAEVFALDRRTGDERWSYETDVLEIGSSPAVTDDRVYIGSHSPVDEDRTGLHALSKDGEERWLFEVDGRGVGSSPALVDGWLYFGAEDNRVYALR